MYVINNPDERGSTVPQIIKYVMVVSCPAVYMKYNVLSRHFGG